MAVFELTRTGSVYPRLARNQIPFGAIFRGTDGTGLAGHTYINMGRDAKDTAYSMNLSRMSMATSTNNPTREVAIVGNAKITRTFLEESQYVEGSLSSFATGSIFIVNRRTNKDGLPIAYGLVGQSDSGERLALDFSNPGLVTKLRANTAVTHVGRFSITGTEV